MLALEKTAGREARCVNAVKIIEIERGKISSTCCSNFVGRHVNGFESGAQIGIVVRCLLLDFFEGRKRSGSAKIVGKNEIVLDIREKQNRQVEPGIQHRKLGFLKLSAAILGLKLGFDSVGGGNFAAMLQLLRQLEKAIAVVDGALGIFQLELRGKRAEIGLGHGDHEAARSDFSLCAAQ